MYKEKIMHLFTFSSILTLFLEKTNINSQLYTFKPFCMYIIYIQKLNPTLHIILQFAFLL